MAKPTTTRKKIVASVKLVIPPAKATPAPPVGPALGQHGLNIMDFCRKFNDETKGMPEDLPVRVRVTIYSDKTFEYEVKSPPTSVLIKRAANIAKGASTTGRDFVGQITKRQVEEIAKQKMKDLNSKDIERAIKIVAGTARSLGIQIAEEQGD